jgi:predicted O-methyltransferase YrrM
MNALILSIILLQGVMGLRLSRNREDHCIADVDIHLDKLRQAGFKIPVDGEHKPKDGVEGGSPHDEFRELVRMAQNLNGSAVVCQTGFNYGTSAYAFLCGGAAKVFSWDLGDHEYVQKANEFITAQFPGKHELVLGNSMETLKDASSKTTQRCDMVFVDGGHSFQCAASDIAKFKSIAKPGALVVVDDCQYKGSPELLKAREQVIDPVSKAFAQAVTQNLLTAEVSHKFRGAEGQRAVCLGHYVN